MKTYRFALIVPTLLALAIFLPAAPAADDTYWTAGDDDWFVPGNWDNGVPGSSDRGHINNGGTAQIAVGSAETEQLFLGEALDDSGTVELSGSGQLSAVHEHIGLSGTGTFTQTGGANTASDGLYVGGEGAGSKGTYTISDGTLDIGNVLSIGEGGTGTFTQTGGTVTASSSDFVLGGGHTGIGGSGTYNYDGGILDLGDVLDVTSEVGQAEFNQGGGNLALEALWVGVGFDGASANGTYTISDGTVDIGNLLSVGEGGIGTFTQTGGTVTASSSDFILGGGHMGIGGSGTYNYDGGILDVGDVLDVTSETGQAEFNQGGGNLALEALWVGVGFDGASANGTYTISDGTLDIGNVLSIGEGGIGTFTQTGGTVTVSGDIYLGSQPGSNATYALSGTGSTLTTGYLFVGPEGDGTLSITDGGLVRVASDLTIGFSVDGDGFIDVGEAGKLLVTGDVDLGVAGVLDVGGVLAANEISVTGGSLTNSGAGSVGAARLTVSAGVVNAAQPVTITEKLTIGSEPDINVTNALFSVKGADLLNDPVREFTLQGGRIAIDSDGLAIDMPGTDVIVVSDTILDLGTAPSATFDELVFGEGSILTIESDNLVSLFFSSISGEGELDGSLSDMIVTGFVSPGETGRVLMIERDASADAVADYVAMLGALGYPAEPENVAMACLDRDSYPIILVVPEPTTLSLLFIAGVLSVACHRRPRRTVPHLYDTWSAAVLPICDLVLNSKRRPCEGSHAWFFRRGGLWSGARRLGRGTIRGVRICRQAGATSRTICGSCRTTSPATAYARPFTA